MMRKVFMLGLALFVSLASSSAFAQTGFGRVTGEILDPNGAAVTGAKVSLNNVATGAKMEVTTNDSGLYTIANVPAAKYEITVEKQGFRGVNQPVTVQVAQTVTVNFSLQIGEITNVVNITEEASAINTSSGELSRTISGAEISNLPLLTRNPYALVALTPGAADTGTVTGDTRGVGLAVNGSRTSGVNFMLDGGENNDTFVAGVGQSIPLDAIQEFKVQSNNMTAEFGRNSVVAN
ncbi:MAG: carboxypeptidase-like regulatory domain-containing protein, partial [Acidobacteriota bacterium]|nr:carboxypeptidase-like regulatory domain-containing protein [Acidobacteriota bacterium]